MNTQTIHKHVGFTDEKGIYAVKRDDKLLLCPKLMYPQIGQVRNQLSGQTEFVTNISRLPCSTECPFAQMKTRKKIQTAENGGAMVTDELENIYEISCEGGTREIVLDGLEEFKKEPPVSPLMAVK